MVDALVSTSLSRDGAVGTVREACVAAGDGEVVVVSIVPTARESATLNWTRAMN